MTTIQSNINANYIVNGLLNNLPKVDDLIQFSGKIGRTFVSLMDSEEVMQGCSALAAVVSIVAGARMLFGSSPAQSIVVNHTIEVVQSPMFKSENFPVAAKEAAKALPTPAASESDDEVQADVAKMGDGVKVVGNQIEIKNSSNPITAHIQQASISRISRVCNGVLGLSCIGAGVLTLLHVGAQANLISFEG